MSLRARAINRLHQKSRIRSSFFVYSLIVLMMVLVWFFTGKGYFWPAWVIFGLSFSLLTKVIRFALPRKITESQIQAEISRLND